MRKLLYLLSLLPILALGADGLLVNGGCIPGGQDSKVVAGKTALTLTADYAAAGTVALWLKPQGWDGDSGEPHLLVHAGRRGKGVSPSIELQQMPGGNLRLLWILDDGKRQLGDISVKNTFFADGQWTHIAFTWSSGEGRTRIALYANGALAGERTMAFSCPADRFPLEWRVNDQPDWAARQAKGKTATGKIAAFPKALAASELETLAREKLLCGKRAYVDSFFTAGSENTLEGKVQAESDAARLLLEFKRENGQFETLEKTLSLGENGEFKTTFRVPDRCVTVLMTMTGADGAFAPWSIGRIEYGPCLRPICPNGWQAWWIRPAKDPAKMGGGTWYFATAFDLDMNAVDKAAFQWVGSNSSQAYINGHDLKRSYRWDSPTAIDDVKPFLKNGRNVIAADAVIPDSVGIVMAELTLLMKDGSVRFVATDQSWYASDTPTPGWNMDGFDPAVWEHARRFQRPPQLPYGETRYKNYVPVPVVKLEGEPWNLRLTPGTDVALEIKGIVDKETPPSEDVWLLMMLGGREFARFPMTCTVKERTVRFCRQVKIPASALGAVYDLSLVSRDFKFSRSVGKLNVALETPLVAEVKLENGAPVLRINGKATPPITQRSSINGRHETSCYRFTTGLDRAGVHLHEVNLSLANLWKPDSSVNIDELDFFLPSTLFYAPHSKLIVFINMDAPAWYKKEHPETLFHSQNGPYDQASYASEKWLADSNAFLCKVVEYIKTRPYYHQIAGFGLDGGEDGQLMQWTGRDRKLVGDYSKNMLDYFHRFLVRKYGTVEALNQAWHSTHASFEAIAIPSKERREGTPAAMFLDPMADLDIVDFNRAFSSCVADVLETYAHSIKELTDRKRLVSAYYGKFFSIAGLLQWGEFDIERILDCPDIDMLIAVDYNQRGAGLPHQVSMPLESCRVHNKIFIDEADIRTFLNGNRAWGAGSNLFDFITCARKMFILSWVRGAGLHWYDLHGGMFENRGIHDAIGTIQKIAERTAVRRCAPAEIAVLVDEKSYLYTTYARRAASNTGRQESYLGKIGAPVDVWFMNDILREDFPKYRMVVVADAWAISAEERQAIERMKADGRLLVFLYNAGYIDGGTRSVDHVARLTGIAMRENMNQNLVMRIQPDEGGIFSLVKKEAYSSRGMVERVAVPSDGNAVALGAFVQGGEGSPMAYRDFGTWKSLYAAVPLLTPEMWMSLAKLAGAWLYTEDTDAMLYVGTDIMGIHSGKGSVKKLRFPKARTFVDAVSGVSYGENTECPEIPLAPGETRILYLK